MENELIVIHQYPSNHLTPFLAPISKHAQAALPKIYGKKVRKRILTQPDEQEYPQLHYLRPCCHNNYEEVAAKQHSVSKGLKVNPTLVQPKNEHCNKKGCACHQQNPQPEKKKPKNNSKRQKSVVLPSVKQFRASDLQDAQSNHKVAQASNPNHPINHSYSGHPRHAMSMDEMELIEPAKGDRYKVGRAVITRSGRESQNSAVQTEPHQLLHKAKTDLNPQTKAVRERQNRSFEPGRPYYQHLEDGRHRKSTQKKSKPTDSQDSFPMEELQATKQFSTLFHQKKQAEGLSKTQLKAHSMMQENGLFRIPQDDELGEFLLKYQPINPAIDIKTLAKKPNFQILPYKDKLYFGQVKQGVRHGQGVSLTQKELFEGNFANNKKTKGFEKNRDGVFEGQYVRGKRHGYGTFKWNNGESFEGEWIEGKKNGHGVWRSPKGDYYEGAWKDNRQNGKGYYCHAGGSTYRGYFVDFLKHGRGVQTFPNGDKYDGSYEKGKPQGYGKYRWANGDEYEGEFSDGEREGRGMLRLANGQFYEGQFEADAKHGYGKQRFPSGEVFEGEFRNGQRYEGVLTTSKGAKVEITPAQ